MIGVWIRMMSMIMRVVMGVVMIVMVPSANRNRDAIGLTNTRAFAFAECTGFSQPFNVVMVA